MPRIVEFAFEIGNLRLYPQSIHLQHYIKDVPEEQQNSDTQFFEPHAKEPIIDHISLFGIDGANRHDCPPANGIPQIDTPRGVTDEKDILSTPWGLSSSSDDQVGGVFLVL